MDVMTAKFRFGALADHMNRNFTIINLKMGINFVHHDLLVGSLIFAVMSSDKKLVNLDYCVFENVVAASEGFVDNVAVMGNPELQVVGDPDTRFHMEETVHASFTVDAKSKWNAYVIYMQTTQLNNSRIEIAWTNIPYAHEYSLFGQQF